MQPTAPRHRGELPGLIPGSSRRKKLAPTRDGQEIALRLLKDGTTETIPLTLDVLLAPSEEVHVPQNDAHSEDIYVMMQRLKRHVERRPGWRLFTDLIVKWPGERDVSPDIIVVEGLEDTSHKRRSLDVAKEGCRVRAVIEVVTTTSTEQREKDEKSNPPLFERCGVTDCLLLYPREHRKAEDVPVVLRSRGRGGKHVHRKPNAKGRFLMRSLGVYVSVRTKNGHEEVVFEDSRTGELLTTVDEEEKMRLQEEKMRLQEEKKRLQEEKKRKAEASKRRRAERQAEEESKARQQAESRAEEAVSQAAAAKQTLARTLLTLLEERGLAPDDDARQRILGCDDLQELQRWLARLPTLTDLDELWSPP